MAEVNEIALIMAIQAVDEKMCALEAQMEEADLEDSELPDLQLEYLDYMKAAHALRAAYEGALVPGDSLPPYAELVRDP